MADLKAMGKEIKALHKLMWDFWWRVDRLSTTYRRRAAPFSLRRKTRPKKKRKRRRGEMFGPIGIRSE